MGASLRISAALGAVLLALAGSAGAQEHGPDHRPDGPPPQFAARMEAHRAQMARDMKTVLRLRPDQEGAWNAFEAAHVPPQRPARPQGPPEPKADLTTPQRLDMMDRRMAEHQARRAKVAAATRTFYAALSPEQQQVFDSLMRLRGPHGGRGHGMMPRGQNVMFGHGGPGGPPPF